MLKNIELRLRCRWFFIMTKPRYCALVVFIVTGFMTAWLSISAVAVPLIIDSPVSYTIRIFAGSTEKGLVDGSVKSASFNWPTGLAIGSGGVVFVADYGNNALRAIGAGKVRTLNSVLSSGTGKGGYKDGVLKDALFQGPNNIAIDSHGNIFVADADNFRIRKITPDGVVSTVAGGAPGYKNGLVSEARFGYPTGVAVDGDGTLYVADRRTHTIRKITMGGVVSTIAGNTNAGYADGKGVMSHLKDPIGVAVSGGIVYVTDSGNNAVRKIMPDGRVLTLAGSPEPGFRDGSGANARFNWPTGIAIGRNGNIYIVDSRNNSIRAITPSGFVTTIIGKSAQPRSSYPSSEGSPAATKKNTKGAENLHFPTGIAIATDGVIYVADSGNNNIKEIVQGR
jgi:sugar lactone lactonase YvrE